MHLDPHPPIFGVSQEFLTRQKINEILDEMKEIKILLKEVLKNKEK